MDQLWLIASVRVYGVPAPQGSKDPWGGEASKRTKPWRTQVAQTVGEALGDEPLDTGPIKVEALFVFPRPKSHYGTGRNAGVLKTDAPHWHIAPNDTDKLCRAIGDALTGVAWKDDKQVAHWDARKVYGERACAVLTITRLAGGLTDDQRGSTHLGTRPDPRRTDPFAV